MDPPNLQQLGVVRPSIGGEPRRPARPVSDAPDHWRKRVLQNNPIDYVMNLHPTDIEIGFVR